MSREKKVLKEIEFKEKNGIAVIISSRESYLIGCTVDFRKEFGNAEIGIDTIENVDFVNIYTDDGKYIGIASQGYFKNVTKAVIYTDKTKSLKIDLYVKAV